MICIYEKKNLFKQLIYNITYITTNYIQHHNIMLTIYCCICNALVINFSINIEKNCPDLRINASSHVLSSYDGKRACTPAHELDMA